MDNEVNYSFDVKFEGDILVVGRTGCSKTTFVQNLGKSKMFGEIKEVVWLSKIPLSKDRENNFCDCFLDEHSVEDFDDLLEYFHRKRAPCNKNYLGENIKLDRLIVMVNISGLTERSEAFANFLTVLQKFGLTCVYLFDAIYPTRQNWQMIISQTKILKFFPGSIQASFTV